MSIKVAVVGAGKMGISHLSILNALPEFNVVGVCDSARLVMSVLGQKTGLKTFTSFEDVLELDELEAIVIATPTVSHEAMVRQALERGLHVFAEKPLTLRAAASAELASLAVARGLISQVGYHNRFVGTFQEGASLIKAGALGRIDHVLAEAYGPVVVRRTKGTWRSKAGQGGGCLHDYAAHVINLLNWYFGPATSCIGASLRKGYSAEVEDQISALLEFEPQTVAHLSVNWSDPSVRKMTTRLSIWGQGGKLYVDRQELQVFFSGQSPIPAGYSEGWNVRYITDLTSPVKFYLRGEEYSAQLEAFGRAILDGRKRNQNDFTSAAETDATIELIVAGRAGASAAAAGSSLFTRTSLLMRVLGR